MNNESCSENSELLKRIITSDCFLSNLSNKKLNNDEIEFIKQQVSLNDELIYYQEEFNKELFKEEGISLNV